MSIRLILTLFITLLTLTISAKTLNDNQKLRRASFILRGIPASTSEYQKGFEDNIDQYLASPQFNQKFSENIYSYFNMRIAHQNESIYNNSLKNSFNDLVKNVLAKNKPWRELFTGTSYNATNIRASFNMGSDVIFFQYIFPELLKEEIQNYVEMKRQDETMVSFDTNGADYQYVKIPLAPKTEKQKEVLAGVFTTGKFFKRYPTTKVNKNRSRAAAIFRTMLCDDMKPIVLTDDSEDQKLLNEALDSLKVHNTNSNRAKDIEKRHGSDPQCMSCHYKLDPMAKVFAGSSLNLNPQASSGRLTYKDRYGKLIDQEVSGINELVNELVKQHEYKSCQVRTLWNWVIGEDVPVTQDIEHELITKFTSLNEKPKDFIKYLVLRNEFYIYQAQRPQDITYSHVKPILKRCDSCHSTVTWAPILSEGYPYTNGIYNNDQMLEKIVLETDLINHGKNPTMPPKNANWTLTKEERDALSAWIKHGGKDNQGNPQIDVTQNTSVINQIVNTPYEVSFSQDIDPSFGNTFSRIISGNDLMKTYKSLGDYDCYLNGDTDRGIIGIKSPISGQSIFKNITPSYFNFSLQCIHNNKYYIANKIELEYTNITGNRPYMEWKTLSLEEKNELITIAANTLLGPNILKQSRHKEIMNYLNMKHDENTLIRIIIEDLSYLILLSEEFLTY